jgi:DNA-binding Lrp family transcriptional regulator
MSITVEGNQTRSVISHACWASRASQRMHDTNGRWDLLAELRCANLKELGDVLERLRLIKGIGATETSIHLQTYAWPEPWARTLWSACRRTAASPT